MSITIGEKYLLKALEAYGYNMEDCVEALNYALSYDEENAEGWLLYGKVMMYYIKDYKGAEEAFVQALNIEPKHSEVLIEFIWLRILESKYEEAQQILFSALQFVKNEQAQLFRLQAVILEYEENYESAIESLEIGLDKTFNGGFQCFLESEITRIKNKIKRKAKQRKKANKKVKYVKTYTSQYSLC